MKCIWCYIANPDLKPHGKFWNWAGQLLEFFHPKEWEPYIICWCTHTLHELWLANSLSCILHFARRESCSQILTTRLYICCCHVCWWIWLNRNVLQMWTCSSSCVQILGGGAKTRQPFSAVCGTKVHQIRAACMGFPVDWQVSFWLLTSCSVADILVKVRSQSQKMFFAPSPWSKCLGDFGPNIPNSSHKWICVEVWLTSIQWPQRLSVEKMERKNHSCKIYALQHLNARQANNSKYH